MLLHRVLFEVPLGQAELFDAYDSPNSTLLRCLKRDVAPGRRASDWREVQANMGMAALLMPRKLFLEIARAVRPDLAPTPFPLVDGSPDGDRLGRELATRFDVSRQATQIRLRTLGLVADPSEPGIGLSPEM